MIQSEACDRKDVLRPLAPQKDLALREQMRDVKPLRSEALVYGIARVPKSKVIGERLNLFVWNDRIHILRGCRRWGRIIEAEPKGATAVDDEGDLVIQSFIEG